MGKITTLQPRISKVEITRGSPVATKRITGKALMQTIKRIGDRDRYICQVCGRLDISGEVDHITPLSDGGQETDSNRQWICGSCHDMKSKEEAKGRL